MIHFVTHEFAPFRGGIATYVRETAGAASRLGYPVRVIAPDYGLDNHPGDAAENFPVERVRCSGRLTPVGIWSLARALAVRRETMREARIVVLSPGALMAMMIARGLGWISTSGPVVAFFHGSEVLRFRRHPLWRRLSACFLPHTKPACASQFVEVLIHESDLVPRNIPIVRAPCACPADVVKSAADIFDITPTRTTGYDPFTLLTLARLHPRKGQHLTARALGLLPPELKQRIHYVIAGEGAPAYRDEVERACVEAGIRHTFRDVASPAELTSIYATCDAFIMTSVRLPNSVEGFGISYLEASVHGKPVIAFRTGGVEEAVLQDQTGLLVAEGDLSGVAVAVQRLMLEPDLRERLGRGGREFALGLSWDNAARALCEG
jgi:phosphatidyl-myo-inositol dimannoside synthase